MNSLTMVPRNASPLSQLHHYEKGGSRSHVCPGVEPNRLSSGTAYGRTEPNGHIVPLHIYRILIQSAVYASRLTERKILAG